VVEHLPNMHKAQHHHNRTSKTTEQQKPTPKNKLNCY
jgi:hypothetical protein